VFERPPIQALLRELRLGAGLTQAKLAERLGCTQRKVTNVERGTRRPSLELLESWAAACGRRYVFDFPPEGAAEAAVPQRFAVASPALRQVVEELLSIEHPSESALRALEGHIAAWKAQASPR
jgi:transcriptional regulator with XRE-family HTH domain